MIISWCDFWRAVAIHWRERERMLGLVFDSLWKRALLECGLLLRLRMLVSRVL